MLSDQYLFRQLLVDAVLCSCCNVGVCTTPLLGRNLNYKYCLHGAISLANTGLNVILSVALSPIVILPSVLIFPVTCKLPSIFVSVSISIVPVPFASNSGALLSVVRIVLSLISIPSTVSLSL